MSNTPPYFKLGTAPRLPRGFADAMRQSSRSMAAVRQDILRNEVHEVLPFDIDMSSPSAAQRYHIKWLEELLDELGVDFHPRYAQLLSYLVFTRVSKHSDGQLQPYLTLNTPFTRFKTEEHLFVNVHLATAGTLVTYHKDWSTGRELRGEHAVEVGDVYFLDQRRYHAWECPKGSLCRALSFSLPLEVLNTVYERSTESEILMAA